MEILLIKKIVNSNLNKGIELKKTIKNLEAYFKQNLSNEDKVYVEDLYIELLLAKWLQQVPEQTIRSIGLTQIVNFAKQLGSVKGFYDCCTYSIKSQFSSLVLKLYDESPRLRECEEISVLRFRQACLNFIQIYVANKGEFDNFINKFVTLLKRTCNLEELGRLLKLRDFINGTITCQEFLQNLLGLNTSDTNILHIQQEKEILINKEYDCLESSLIEIINQFLKPVDVKLVKADGRDVIEVKGTHIVWSRDLMKLEREEYFCHAHEVRVVNAFVIHADVNLTNRIWHGKNLVIFSETLILSNGVTKWDVSGTDGGEVSSLGAKSVPGESGGNVLLKVDSVEGGNLIILSNGGNGSRGLDGSPGTNGVDGDSIDGVSFKKMFPPPSKFINSDKIVSIKKNKKSLRKKLKQVEIFECNGIEIQDVSLTSLLNWFSNEELTDFFIKGKTDTGCEVTFSFFYGSLLEKCQSYLLYKGAPGKQGTPGGMGGLGGGGGFSGDIDVHISSSPGKVKYTRINGQHGTNGQPGTCGKPGTNGTDCGYMDVSLSTDWPKIFVTNPDDHKILTIEYSDKSSSNNVYCPYQMKYAEIKYKENRLSKSSSCYEQTLRFGRPNHNIQQATRKKTIDLKSMMNQYQTNTLSCFANYSVETLVSIVNEFMIRKDLEKEHAVKESKIGRQLSYNCNTGCISITIPEDSSLDQLDILPKNERTRKYQGLKYKLKVLSDIDVGFVRKVNLEPTNGLQFHNSFSEDYDKIFSVNENQEDFFSEYFGFDSSESREKVKKLFYGSDKSYLADTALLFINVYGFSNCTSYTLSQSILSDRLIPLIMLLEHQEFCKLYKLLCKCILGKNRDLFVKFSFLISQNTFLNKLYRLYQSEAIKPKDWINSIDDKIDKQLRKCISEKLLEFGPYTEIYREFLSHYYKKNIFYYSLDKKGQIKLISNHNPLGETKIHILLKEDKFYQLSVNVDFLEILQCQKVRGCLYSKILSHVDTLTDTNDIDKFAARSPFKLKIYKGVEKSIASYVKYTQIISQDRDIKTIQSNFSSDDVIFINPRLEKLKVEFIGYSNILHYMALHFENEGKSITAREFCLILNFIVENTLTMPSSLPLVSWTIASSSPKYWLIEFTLHKLEIYLRKNLKNETKDRWRNYLGNLDEKDRLMAFFEKICEESSFCVGVDCIDEVLYLMSCVPRAHVGLKHIDLELWKYYLKDKYWWHQLKANTIWPEDIVTQASLYLAMLDNNKGFKQTKKVLKVVINHASMMENECDAHLIVDVLRDLTNKEICLDDGFIEILFTATIQDWRIKLEEACFDSDNERSLKQVVELVKTCGNTSTNIKENLSKIESLVENVNMKMDKMYDELSKENKLKEWIHCVLEFLNNKNSNISIPNFNFLNTLMGNILSIFDKNFRDKDARYRIMKDFTDHDEIILATVIIAIKEKLNINLRNTQKLAIVMFLQNKGNLLAQISTGEGKSLIIVCIAIMKAISGQKVDIITSSPVLAKRDSEIYSEVYELFGLSVGHNCHDNLEERKKAYSNSQVVYGELSNFQQDFLLDRIYDKNVLGDRNFQTILVDEVDSLLLDRGNNTLYLSHEIPGLDKLEPVFVYIWKWFNTPKGESVLELKEDILFALGHINKNCLTKLDSDLNETDIDEIWEIMVSEGIISKSGMLKDAIDVDKLNNTTRTKKYIVNHLKYLWIKVNEREKQFDIPNYLKCFVLRHLDNWIDSAQIAMSLENGRHYVVDVDRTGTSSDRSPNITILDGDTGTDLATSQWENGLHQFLQLKHGCRQFAINLKAVFISNVSYIKKYERLYGLSGTLGTSMERKLLIDLYDVGYVTIPTAKAKSFLEIPPITCRNEYDWGREIFSSVQNIASNRSALIICESVNDAMFLKDQFKLMENTSESRFIQIHTYTRDYEKLDIAEKLESRQIIISTNLAGRGTDIKLSNELIEAGGLHVCLTFLPRNSRVEEQAFGRVSRNGQPGSAQIIFMSGYENSISKIVDLKKQRNLEEINRITNINSIYEKRIKKEEKYFEKFQDKYLELKNNKKHSKNIKSLLLQICLDKWAFWLDENCDAKISVSIDDFITDITNVFEHNTKTNYIQNPFQLSKMAFIYLQENNFETSKELFDKVIEEESSFSEMALYYRIVAITSLAKKPTELSEIIEDFSSAEKLLEKRISSSLITGNFIDWLKTQNMNSIIQIDSFRKQQEQRCIIYNMFLDSINNITGHVILPQDLLPFTDKNNGISNEFTALMVYSTFMECNAITKPKLKPFLEKDLKYALQYGIDPKNMSKFLKTNKNIIGNVYMANNCLNISQDKKVSDFWEKLKQYFPSRELFWSELLIEKQLVNEVKYLFVDWNRLHEQMPYLTAILNSLEVEKPTFKKTSIFLYTNDEKIRKGSNLIILKKDVLMSFLGIAIYRFLKKQGIIYNNKIADIGSCWNKPFRFEHFDSLLETDFGKVGINSKVARTIISELEQNNIIKKSNSSDYYYLISNEEGINKIKLFRHQAYTSDVKALLTHCFAFRLAYQKLVHMVSTSGIDGQNVNLPLQTNLHKLFFDELQDTLLTKPKVNHEIDIDLKKLYPRSMSSEQWEEMFSTFFSKLYVGYIVRCLKESGWLSITRQKTFIVNCAKAENGSDSNFVLISPKPLPLNLKCYEKYIELILLDYLNLVDEFESIKTRLKERVGAIYSKETPSFYYKPVLSVLNESILPTSECHFFYLNGFDQLLIVKEKEYSLKMKISVSLVAALGVAEIAAGTALMMCFPGFGAVMGEFMMSEGCADLIYSTSCLYSGYFNFSDYKKNKLISMTISAFASCCKLVTMYKSVFGTKSAGISKLGKTIGKTGSGGNVVAQRIISTTSLAVSRVVISTTIKKAIEQEFPKLGKILTAIIYNNIDEVVVKHEVIQSVRNIYVHFGKDETMEIVNDCFERAIYTCKPMLPNYLANLLSIFRTVMGGNLTTLNNIVLGNGESISFSDVVQLINDVCKLISTSPSCLSEIKSMVSQILNVFQDNLSLHCNDNLEEENVGDCNNYFIFRLTEKWKEEIKNVLTININENVLSPLFLFTSHMLFDYSYKNYSFFSSKEINEITKSKSKKNQHEKSSNKVMSGKDHFVESEYNKILFSLLKAERHASVLAEISKRNLPADMNCIEMCCEIVPTALRKGGIEVPPFEVVVERNGIRKKYKFAADGSNTTKIYLTDNESILSNVSNNQSLCIKGVIHIIGKSLCPRMTPYLNDLLNNVVNDLETSDSNESELLISPVTRKHIRNKPSKGFIEYINSLSGAIAYQHKNWTFKPCVDIDLREKTISHSDAIDFIIEGFDAALEKINHYISTTLLNAKRSLKLNLQDFSELKYEIWPNTKQSASIPFHCQAVHYELVLPLPVETQDTLWDFLIKITLHTQLEKRAENSPRGAHIRYEVRPLAHTRHQEKGLRGHVLLNSKCQRTTQTVSRCHVAGELILPKCVSFQH